MGRRAIEVRNAFARCHYTHGAEVVYVYVNNSELSDVGEVGKLHLK